MAVMPEVSTVALEAHELAYGDRNAAYGHPRQNHERIAALWTAMFGEKLNNGATISAEDVLRAMILVKVSRDVNSPRRDNRVDITGYAICLDRLETGL